MRAWRRQGTADGWASLAGLGNSPVQAEQAQRSLLLEIQRAGWGRLDLADAAPELGYLGPHPLVS